MNNSLTKRINSKEMELAQKMISDALEARRSLKVEEKVDLNKIKKAMNEYLSSQDVDYTDDLLDNCLSKTISASFYNDLKGSLKSNVFCFFPREAQRKQALKSHVVHPADFLENFSKSSGLNVVEYDSIFFAIMLSGLFSFVFYLCVLSAFFSPPLMLIPSILCSFYSCRFIKRWLSKNKVVLSAFCHGFSGHTRNLCLYTMLGQNFINDFNVEKKSPSIFVSVSDQNGMVDFSSPEIICFEKEVLSELPEFLEIWERWKTCGNPVSMFELNCFMSVLEDEL